VHQSEYLKQTLASILDAKNQYGTVAKKKDKVLIDFSSPNITKPDTDHLRSTLLGNFVRNIYQSQGYSTIATNYFGDWREQYGKLYYYILLFQAS
jgi:arginyl-tRNA synthetase